VTVFSLCAHLISL